MKRTVTFSGLCAAALSLLCLAVLSCEPIFEYEGDCSAIWKVDFRYDMNMKYADAFGHEADSLVVYAFDRKGNLVWYNTEQGDTLAHEDYVMPLGLKPGVYDLVAWSRCESAAEHFVLPAVDSLGEIDGHLFCELVRSKGEDGRTYVQEHIGSLMHGSIDSLVIMDDNEDHIVPMSMTKNTNRVRVILQQLSSEDIDKDSFSFAVTDRNAVYGFDNSLLPCEEVTYREWKKSTGYVSMDPGDGSGNESVSTSAVVAELTVGRLVEGNDTRLTVTDGEGDVVFSIPLIDYALMIKGHYDDMSDQEYLDRQDEYVMTFFLDSGMRWIDSYIYINSWKVVLSNVDFK